MKVFIGLEFNNFVLTNVYTKFTMRVKDTLEKI